MLVFCVLFFFFTFSFVSPMHFFGDFIFCIWQWKSSWSNDEKKIMGQLRWMIASTRTNERTFEQRTWTWVNWTWMKMSNWKCVKEHFHCYINNNKSLTWKKLKEKWINLISVQFAFFFPSCEIIIKIYGFLFIVGLFNSDGVFFASLWWYRCCYIIIIFLFWWLWARAKRDFMSKSTNGNRVRYINMLYWNRLLNCLYM